MKACRASFLWLLLLLLLGVSAWNPPGPGPAAAGWMPGLAVAALLTAGLARTVSGRVWVAGAALLGLLAAYAWNPAYRWNEGLGLLPVDHVPWLPASVHPAGSWGTFTLALAMWAAFALAFQLSERHVGWLQMAALTGAVAMALGVLAQRLEPGHARLFAHTGIFVNENHFAVFINMLLPVVLAMASRARFRAVQEGRPSSPAGLYLLAAVLMGAAVVACRSRAGVAVMTLLVAAHVHLRNRLVRRFPFADVPISPGAKRLGWLAILVVAALAVLAFAREWRQAGDIRAEWVFRSGILKDTLAVWRDHRFWGTGPGTFSAVFPYFQSALFQGRTILHAHCEPMQFLSEFGLAGGLWVVLAAGLAGTARTAAAPVGGRIPPFASLERRAFVLGLAACALHALIDFPLRIPLLALLAATWAGVWAGHRPAPVRAAPPAASNPVQPTCPKEQ